jgi:catechol 2,3-dioxygenase-like lactoylglutathione lyase family enzyme
VVARHRTPALRRRVPCSGEERLAGVSRDAADRTQQTGSGGELDTPDNDLVSVRYMVNDVEESIDFYTRHFGFSLRHSALPAFADVVRGRLRLLLAGPESSTGRPMPDGRRPGPGGRNRIHFVVDDIVAEVERLRSAGLSFRNDVVSGPGGQQSFWTTPLATQSSSSSPPRPRPSRKAGVSGRKARHGAAASRQTQPETTRCRSLAQGTTRSTARRRRLRARFP